MLSVRAQWCILSFGALQAQPSLSSFYRQNSPQNSGFSGHYQCTAEIRDMLLLPCGTQIVQRTGDRGPVGKTCSDPVYIGLAGTRDITEAPMCCGTFRRSLMNVWGGRRGCRAVGREKGGGCRGGVQPSLAGVGRWAEASRKSQVTWDHVKGVHLYHQCQVRRLGRVYRVAQLVFCFCCSLCKV